MHFFFPTEDEDRLTMVHGQATGLGLGHSGLQVP